MRLAELVSEIRARAQGRARYLVGIAGAPGSGKSTLASDLATALGKDAAVLPMDGFHLDNETLTDRGLFERKGAPETFDSRGFADLLARAKTGVRLEVPTFDRAADRVVPCGTAISETVRIVVVEGNYLLLDAPAWHRVTDALDLTFLLEVPEDVLEARLIGRWLDHGLAPVAAEQRARKNDIPNARLVQQRSRVPDAVLRPTTSAGGPDVVFEIAWVSEAEADQRRQSATRSGEKGGES